MPHKVIKENEVYGILSQNYTFIPFADQTYDFSIIQFVESSSVSIVPAELVYGSNVLIGGKIRKWSPELEIACKDTNALPRVTDFVAILVGAYRKKVDGVHSAGKFLTNLTNRFFIGEVVYFMITFIAAFIFYDKLNVLSPFMAGYIYAAMRYIDAIKMKYGNRGDNRASYITIVLFLLCCFATKSLFLVGWTLMLLFYTSLKFYCVYRKYYDEYARLIKFTKNI